MTGKIYHPEDKHPEPYRQDLNPDANVGQNTSEAAGRGKTDTRPASEIKEAHAKLPDFGLDDLKRIPILRPGGRLEQGATYLDLKASRPHEFTATGDVEADEENWFVPKSAVDYELWNRLRGVTDPARTGGSGA